MPLLLIALLFSLPANAGPYIELGIAKADGGTCIEDWKAPGVYGCSASPLGNLTIGYEWRGFSVEVEHWSSLVERDRGLNLFGIKYRYQFGGGQ